MKSQTHDSTKVWLHDGASLYIQTSPLAQPCPLSYWSANGETSAKSVRANFPTFNQLHLDTFQPLLWEGRLLGCGRYSGAACTMQMILPATLGSSLGNDFLGGKRLQVQKHLPGSYCPQRNQLRGSKPTNKHCKRVKSCSKQLEKLS